MRQTYGGLKIEKEPKQMHYYSTVTKPIPENKSHWSDLGRAIKQIPASLTEWNAVSEIAEKHDLSESETLDMRVKLAEWVADAKAASKASVGFSKGIATRHTFETPDRLPNLSMSDYSGVIALRAPLGSGKTQIVGVSFVDAIRDIGRVACITHLRSLVAEMARRLNSAHYETITETQLLRENALAITSASLCNGKFDEFFGTCYYLFIDEFSQVRRFLASESCGTNAAASYAALRRHIAAAKCVIVTDADLSDEDIRFLEEIRPAEKFRVIDAQPPMPARTIDYIVGEDSAEYIIGAAEQEMLGGGNVWIGCESAARAAAFGEYFKQRGFKALSITSDEKGGKEQEAFLNNPDEVSRQYQVVVHSPVISCGVSIEHKDGHHFTAAFWIGGGRAILPSDAGQAIRRVRYLNHTTVGLLNNSEGKPKTARTLDAEFLAANPDKEITEYKQFQHRVEAEESAAKAAFMARFCWQRQDAGYTLNRLIISRDASRKADVKEIRTAQIEAKREALKSAPAISAADAEKLERNGKRTKEENIALEAHNIRSWLNITEVSDEAITLWDNGYGMARMARFMAYRGALPVTADQDRQIESEALVAAYAAMFEGISFEPGHVFRRDEIETIYQRCKENALAWAYLGITPKSVQPEVTGRGELKFPKKPAPNRFIGDLLDKMGLCTNRGTYTCPLTGHRIESRRIDAEHFETMTKAMSRIKVWDLPTFYNTKFAVSPTPSEQSEHDISDLVQPALMPEIEPQQDRPIVIPDKPEITSSANDAGEVSTPDEAALLDLIAEMTAPFADLPSTSTGEAWIPLSDENGFQLNVQIPVPDCFAYLEESVQPIPGRHGDFIALPYPLDVSHEMLDLVRNSNRPAYILNMGEEGFSETAYGVILPRHTVAA